MSLSMYSDRFAQALAASCHQHLRSELRAELKLAGVAGLDERRILLGEDEVLAEAAGRLDEDVRHLPSLLQLVLRSSGIRMKQDDAMAVQEVLWTTSTPASSRMHLFLALCFAKPEQLVEAGLDRVFALADALEDLVSDQPAMGEYFYDRMYFLLGKAASLVERDGQKLLDFVGSQPLWTSPHAVRCRGYLLVALADGLPAVAVSPWSIWRMRQKLLGGTEIFDRAVSADWDNLSKWLRRDFLSMLDADQLPLDPNEFLDVFPRALESDDWRCTLAMELGRRSASDSSSSSTASMWQRALARFRSDATDE